MSEEKTNGFSNNVKACYPIITMACITALASVGLFMGIDGVILQAVIGILAGVGGLGSGYILAKNQDAQLIEKLKNSLREEEEGD